ncbi:MAG: transporter substrate-binding protein [Paenibacillus sp.]|jgi:multiple sugar transport system substrate-binding protein|nr:transporter substrate-binding protein [Paenibacillus sp.]
MKWVNRKGEQSMKRKAFIISLLLLFVVSATGCSKTGQNEENSNNNPNAPLKFSTEPVTLTMYTDIPEQLFEETINQQVKKKYPFITLQQVYNKGQISELVLSGNVPDLIHTPIGTRAFPYTDQNLFEDLMPLIKKHQFDVNRIDDTILATSRAVFEGKTLALPFATNNTSLYYNKSIFDRFGVAYPRDGMSWDETVELATKMTRVDNGVQYRGFHFQPKILAEYNQLSLSSVDGKTEKSLVNSDGWKQYFDMMKRFYVIQGNQLDESTYSTAVDLFLKKQTLAMIAVQNIIPSINAAEKTGFTWDMVTMPSLPSRPGTLHQMIASGLAISTTSKYKDQAFMVIEQILSDDVQNFRHTTLASPAVLKNLKKDDFGKNFALTKGQNITALIKHKFAAPQPFFTRYDQKALVIVDNKFKDVVIRNKDTNTALREAEEEINKMIEQEKTTKK